MYSKNIVSCTLQRWVSFVPQKTTVKRATQQDHPRITSDKTFRTAKEAFDSQIKSLSTIQQKATGTSTNSLAGSFMSNIQPGGHTPSEGNSVDVVLGQSNIN